MGAPTSNLNGLKHGGHRLERLLTTGKVDGRSELGVAQRRLRSRIEADLGGTENLSTQERLIVDRIVKKILMIEAIETYAFSRRSILKRNGDLIGCLGKNYLAYSAELRRDLLALGLQRRAKDVPDLKAYLAARATQPSPDRTKPEPYHRTKARR